MGYNDVKTKTTAAFSDVFSDILDNKPMCAEKMKIYLKQNAAPYRVIAPHPIPLRFQEPVNSEIARYFKSGIIIPCDEPKDWCSPAFYCQRGTSNVLGLLQIIHVCCQACAPLPFGIRHCAIYSGFFDLFREVRRDS